MSQLEDYMKELHAKQYTGTGDDMPEDFERWLESLTDEEFGRIAKEFISN